MLERWWWRSPTPWPSHLLRPLSWLYRLLYLLARLPRRMGLRRAGMLPVPVVVVGNLVVGGAGKTPTVLALVRALRSAGWTPGVISRGYGASSATVREVTMQADASQVGDEPLLIQRSTGVAVFVGAQRVDAARALLAAHPQVDVIVSDDGLQHDALARQLQLIVFDGRGVGNGLLLPAGPLREPLPGRLATVQAPDANPGSVSRAMDAGATQPATWVVYNAAKPSTPLAGALAQRALSVATPLDAWWARLQNAVDVSSGKADRPQAIPVAGLRGPPLLAAAGIAEPERFFSLLDAAGLNIRRLPLPDHFPFSTLPWPADTAEVVVTEKDAIKLVAYLGRDLSSSPTDSASTAAGAAKQSLGSTKVWVVTLDYALPAALLREVLGTLERLRQTS